MGIKSAVEILIVLKDPVLTPEGSGYRDAASDLLLKLARAAERAGVPFTVSVTIHPPGKPAATVRSTPEGICWSTEPGLGSSEQRLVEGLVHDSTGLDTLARCIVDEIEKERPTPSRIGN